MIKFAIDNDCWRRVMRSGTFITVLLPHYFFFYGSGSQTMHLGAPGAPRQLSKGVGVYDLVGLINEYFFVLTFMLFTARHRD